MQAVDESRPNDGGSGSFLSPGKAFALLAGVILVIGAVLFVTRPDAAPAPPNAPTNNNAAPPTFELTNAEALTRFQQLDALRQDAYYSLDRSLIGEIFVPGSEISGNVRNELMQLQKDNVEVRSRFSTVQLDVLENHADAITIQQVVLIQPKFVSNGRDITKQEKPVRQTIEWTLQVQDGEWLIAEAVITKSQIRD